MESQDRLWHKMIGQQELGMFAASKCTPANMAYVHIIYNMYNIYIIYTVYLQYIWHVRPSACFHTPPSLRRIHVPHKIPHTFSGFLSNSTFFFFGIDTLPLRPRQEHSNFLKLSFKQGILEIVFTHTHLPNLSPGQHRLSRI